MWNARWLGGMMTNFKTMRTRVDQLNQLEDHARGRHLRHAAQRRKSRSTWARSPSWRKYLGGVKEMKAARRPIHRGHPQGAQRHRRGPQAGIPVVAIADTNCDPDEIDYVIPGNDDAIRAIKLISSIMANAVLEGKQGEQTAEAASEEAAADVE